MGASASVKSLELGEYRVNYASEGTGPTMVMLHGSDKREDWRVWEPLMDLSREFSLVIPDLIGFGRSTIPVETPDYRVQARVLHEMMERLGLQKAILVGTSWGGQVALEMAINWPQSVEDLVLILEHLRQVAAGEARQDEEAHAHHLGGRRPGRPAQGRLSTKRLDRNL